VVELVALLLPLSLDTFAIAAGLGAAGLPAASRLRVGLVFMGFEAAMPLIEIVSVHTLGHAIGTRADYLAGAELLGLGGYLLVADGDDESAGHHWSSGAHTSPSVRAGVTSGWRTA
jgi:putative Mn2+ efflux pump MntP